MTEIGRRGLQVCLTEAFGIVTDECEGVCLSVDIDVCDPGHAPGTGTPEPGGLSARELLDSVRRICLELPVVGLDVVEVSPPHDHAEITAALAAALFCKRCPPLPAGARTPATALLGTPLRLRWTVADKEVARAPRLNPTFGPATLRLTIDRTPCGRAVLWP